MQYMGIMIKHFDFVIIGSTPLSAVLSGVLSGTHGATVCWVGTLRHRLRPQSGFDVSVGPITRPDTWRLLQDCVPQTVQILDHIDNGKITERVDTLMISQRTDGSEALAHIRNTAPAYDIPVEREAISDAFGAAYRFRDATRVLRRPLISTLPDWLRTQNVTLVSEQQLRLVAQKDGLVRMETDEAAVTANSVWLCDDQALSAHGRPKEIDRLFNRTAMTSLLFEPVKPLASAVTHAIDTGLMIYQRPSGALDCVGPGAIDIVGDATATIVAQSAPLRLAGQSRFISLDSRDGGAICGESRTSGISMLGGLGVTGLFQVPAIARVLAKTASASETGYFAKRAPSKIYPRAKIAEFSTFMPSEMVS